MSSSQGKSFISITIFSSSLFNVAVNKENQHVFFLTVADNVFMLLVIYQKFRIVDSDESCHESCHVLCHIVMTS